MSSLYKRIDYVRPGLQINPFEASVWESNNLVADKLNRAFTCLLVQRKTDFEDTRQWRRILKADLKGGISNCKQEQVTQTPSSG
jgi:hypothetical protein